MKYLSTILARWTLVLLLVQLAACSPEATVPHSQTDGHAEHAHHHHEAPHGGTVLVLGEEQFHLEWVKEESLGVMRCYVLDAHMEQFVRIAVTEWVASVVQADGSTLPWTFKAVANRATGESIGDTSEFQAPLKELPDQNSFEGFIAEIHIRGISFNQVAFRFPEGNEA